MKPWGSNSLRARLTWRMIIMQALVLMTFTAVAAVPIYGFISDDQRFDDRVVDDIYNSIQRDESGALQVGLDEELREKIAEYPALWFFAFDGAGSSAQMGPVPDRLLPMLGALVNMRSANISGLGADETVVAILRRHDGEQGRMWIVTGNGPEIGFRSVFGNPFFGGLLLMLTLVSFLVIPLVVGRELRGVDKVAIEADRIDIAQRGKRLSLDHVPLELHSLVGAVNAALQRLDDGIERRHRFLADAAHELRTPIAILQMRLELLPEGPERARLLMDVGRLGNLANQLLDLERLEAEVTEFKTIDLVALAAQVASDMAPVVIAADCELSFESEARSVLIHGDTASLSRALINLVQNAVIHGGNHTAIVISVARDGCLSVSDSGPGIAPEHRDSIFEPFSRIVPLDQGAGLGLSLVKDIIMRHGGHITVGDAQGGGAIFEVSLPLDTDGDTHSAANA